MTAHKDIIGVMKELQAGKPDGWPEAIRSKNANEVEICKHFPAIASALLIAVKALEKTEHRTAMGGNEEMTIHSVEGIAIDALSRIRSLPLSA